MNEEKLSTSAILANIDHYECLVDESKLVTEKHLTQLEYWLNRLEKQTQ
jgi:hypothetical protein